MKTKITVILDLPDGTHKTVCRELEWNMARGIFRKLDHPTDCADGLARMFCTRSEEIRRVDQVRQRAAKDIANNLTDVLMGLFKLKDTEMGYEKTW